MNEKRKGGVPLRVCSHKYLLDWYSPPEEDMYVIRILPRTYSSKTRHASLYLRSVYNDRSAKREIEKRRCMRAKNQRERKIIKGKRDDGRTDRRRRRFDERTTFLPSVQFMHLSIIFFYFSPLAYCLGHPVMILHYL